MTDWVETTLGQVVELKRGYDLPSARREPGPVPIISSSGRSGFHSVAKVRGPGVVTGRYGTLGQVFFVEEDFWPLNTALYVRDFRGNSPRFVSALLTSLNLGRNEAAAAVPGVNRNHLHRLPVRLPAKRIQDSIARILTSLDDLIENNRRRIELLEQMAQAIYREWFVHFRYPGHEKDELVDSPLGPIPSGWVAPPLRELVDTRYGHTDSAVADGPGPKFVRVMDINKLPFIDWSRVPHCSPVSDERAERVGVRPGDVVVARMADPGKVGIVEEHRVAIFASYLVRIRANRSGPSPYFLFYSLRESRYQDFILGASTGTTRKSVSAQVMVEAPFLLPPAAIVESFESQATTLRTLLTVLVRKNACLAGLRDLLLPKLVSGEIDVSNLDLDTLTEAALV